MTVGDVNSTERPPDRTLVAQFYAVTGPNMIFDSAARQIATAKGLSMSENARALALISMAINDSLIASFLNKYHYNFWRPITAIRNGDIDGNPATDREHVPIGQLGNCRIPSTVIHGRQLRPAIGRRIVCVDSVQPHPVGHVSTGYEELSIGQKGMA